MNNHQADVVIIGGGIAGIATAYYLSLGRSRNIILVDKLQPMSLTTACSGENFRNFWPQECMTAFTSHSYELMQDLIAQYGDVFALKQTGYEFISKHDSAMFGATEAEIAEAFDANRDYLAPDVSQITRVHQAGAFDVYGLGSLLLKVAKQNGVTFLQSHVESLDQVDGGYKIVMENDTLSTKRLVVAAGPFTSQLLENLDITLPLESFCQSKFVIPDPERIVPRDMPFTICADEITLKWAEEEEAALRSEPDLGWLIEALPPGLHIKPEGSHNIKMGWAYNRTAESPVWQCHSAEVFPDVVMRGASQYLPGLEAYVANMPTPMTTFAGYYTRTPDNLPLVCPLDDRGLFMVGALSGYGTMSACAAGALCTAYIDGLELPEYAPFLHSNRYTDPGLVKWLDALDNDGQL